MTVATGLLTVNATFVVELIAFLAVLGVMAKFVLPPLNRTMRRRQHEIQAALDKGSQIEARLSAAEAVYQARVEEGRRRARLIVERARARSDQLLDDASRKAEQDYAHRMARALAEIDRAAERVRKELEGERDEAGLHPASAQVGQVLRSAGRRALADPRPSANGVRPSREPI